MKRLLLIALTLLLPTLSHAADLQLGRDYTLIEPAMPQSNPGKIEVIEFFSYGCPHCNEFNPLIKEWAAKAPSDITFRKVPITFGRPAWAKLASIYYALEATGDLAKLDSAVFTATNVDRVNFNNDEKIVEWAVSKGVNAKKFSDALSSFSMQSQLRRGDQDASAAKVSGVPAIVVAGRYLVRNEGASSYADLVRLTNDVIAKARQEMTSVKK
jgi:thiol:disulfide interchange protein DsbA